MKKKITILEIKKYLKKKGFTIIRKKANSSQENNLGSISRTILSSLVIIFVFFMIPIVLDYKKERAFYSKDYENTSKNKFKKTIEGQTNKSHPATIFNAFFLNPRR